MKKALKTQIYPTPEQAYYLARAAGSRGFVYNWALETWNNLYKPESLLKQKSCKAQRLKTLTECAKGPSFRLGRTRSVDNAIRGEQYGGSTR